MAVEHAKDSELLQPGLYDQLLSRAVAARLEAAADPHLHASLEAVDPQESHTAIAQFLERLLVSSLSTLRGADNAQRQRRVVDRLIATLADELGPQWVDHVHLADPLRRLLAIHANPPQAMATRPDTPLARSSLLTGTRVDPSLASQLNKEIQTADRVDILCSFIRWSGLRLLLDALRSLTQLPHPEGIVRLRVITTSYMGATDPKAIEALQALDHTQISVSYDTRRTRLHAKAYLIHRQTGFGSAYIGSANISHAALSEGLEWTSKISQYELPHLWQKTQATFETYWNDKAFEPYSLSDRQRLREAIERERTPQGGDGDSLLPNFDLRPYPFQEEILDALAAEREIHGKSRHLVVSATGTGKTMVAAFDYRRWCQEHNDRKPLLFIAHREEILRQALFTFRAVLRDHNFGDLLVGGKDPQQIRHLFCSIQSYNSRALYQLEPDHYAYVVVDEFHHGAASGYLRLLEHVKPRILLGLTATPERMDGRDVRDFFDGEFSAEIRLPDAIQRRLLCPFQYFGVADSVDLSNVRWQPGGYRVDDLEDILTGNDVRAALVLDKVHEILLNPHKARGIGFCVSVNHARFMAAFFNRHGLPAISLDASSSPDIRQSARERLVRREINFIFVVDLYNEGIDIPEIDTVLFLRPTESLTVYLQQFGRGLRLHDEKECLTVLDFISAHRREFRFASRLRSLSTDPTGRLEQEVEAGFPHLPAGCFIQLERVAQQHVLDNIRQSLKLHRPRLIGDLRQLGGYLGRSPSLQEAMDYCDAPLEEILKRGLWSRLLFEAGLASLVKAPDEDQLARGIRRLAHIDDSQHIGFLLTHLDQPTPTDPGSLNGRRLAMLHITLWGGDGRNMSLEEAEVRLHANPAVVADLRSMLNHRLQHTHTRPLALQPDLSGPLALHALYTRDEILAGLGHWSMEHRPDFREGALHLPQVKVEAFFITLHKSDSHYSPTTMYEDYAISDSLFHWQSQSTTSAQSPTGQRYIHHRSMGYTLLPFVREYRHTAYGQAAPYAFLGPGDYVSHKGSRPISIVWRMRCPIPSRLLRAAVA